MCSDPPRGAACSDGRCVEKVPVTVAMSASPVMVGVCETKMTGLVRAAASAAASARAASRIRVFMASQHTKRYGRADAEFSAHPAAPRPELAHFLVPEFL